ncbi:MAG: ATP-dependent zinc protease [Thiotrichales bacterium]
MLNRKRASMLRLFSLLGFLSALMPQALAQAPLTGAGYLERAYLNDADGLAMHAKLDTGADSSSLDVADLRTEMRDNAPWVVFAVQDRGGKTVSIERPLLRTARIKRGVFGVEERPVVEMELCLGGVVKRTQINLADRSSLKYPLLIGRDFLAGTFVVDAGQTYRLGQTCAAGIVDGASQALGSSPALGSSQTEASESIELVPAREIVITSSTPRVMDAPSTWRETPANQTPETSRPVSPARFSGGIGELLELSR